MARKGQQPVNLWVPRRNALVILLAIIICAVVAHFHVQSVGTRIDYRLDDFAGTTISPDDVMLAPPDMAAVTDIRYDGDVPIVTFEGTHEGEGLATVATPSAGGSFAFRVAPGNVVVTDDVNFDGWEAVGWGIAVCFAVATAVFAWNLSWLWRRSWYGYEMVFYLGSMMFCLCQAIEFSQAMLSGKVRCFADLALMIVSTSEHFMVLVLPLVVLAAAAVTVSNAILVRREGLGARNLLGIALGVAVVAFFLAKRLVAANLMDSNPLLELGANSVVSAIGAFGMAMFLSTCACALLAAMHRPSMPRDYVIVLGSGIRSDGTPTPLLAGRVDTAREFAEEQEGLGMGLPKLVCSGGQGPDEPTSEAAAMRGYLVGQGFPEERILEEGESTSTQENFRLSERVIRDDWETSGCGGNDGDGEHGGEPSVAFSTTNYHVFRSYVWAHEAGMSAEGMAAPTKLYFWPNAFLREFVGFVAASPLTTVICLAVIILLYGVAEYVTLFA